jgi:hypothetical protein
MRECVGGMSACGGGQASGEVFALEGGEPTGSFDCQYLSKRCNQLICYICRQSVNFVPEYSKSKFGTKLCPTNSA